MCIRDRFRVVTHHQYGISALVPLMSLCGGDVVDITELMLGVFSGWCYPLLLLLLFVLVLAVVLSENSTNS